MGTARCGMDQYLNEKSQRFTVKSTLWNMMLILLENTSKKGLPPFPSPDEGPVLENTRLKIFPKINLF